MNARSLPLLQQIAPTVTTCNDLNSTFGHRRSRLQSNILNLVAQILSLCNVTESTPPECPSFQTVSSALAPQPLDVVGRRAWSAIFAVMIGLAKPIYTFPRKKNPSRSGWYIHGCKPLLFRSLARHLDPLHKAYLRMERHAYWLFSINEVHCTKCGGIEQSDCLSVPATFFLEILHWLNVCIVHPCQSVADSHRRSLASRPVER